jgi:tellurite resistance protein TehA-like permease
MATGIVSVALNTAGFPVLSLVFLGVDIALWLALAASLCARLVSDRDDWLADARTPSALSAVAATSVLGDRFLALGWRALAWALLVIALLAWLVLMPLVLGSWQHPTVGASFLVVVATQGLAVTAGGLALAVDAGWLTAPVIVGYLAGLLGYVWVIASFDWTQLARGRGDHWVLPGTLAISALAGSETVSLTDPRGAVAALTALFGTMRVLAFVVLGCCLAAYAALVGAEIRWPRPRYHVNRWATVFPLGMTAAAAMSVATATGAGWLGTLGHVLVWPAVAVWAVAAFGAVRNEPSSFVAPGPHP